MGADDKFEASFVEESAARSRLQRAGNLDGHTTGTATKRKEYKAEENAVSNHMQPARNPVDQATG